MPTSKKLSHRELKDLLDEWADRYNRPDFIENDPISIPHRFTKKQDIEIAGLFAATLAWGQRVTIIRNAEKLMQWMDNRPYEFILHHKPADLRKLAGFVHRTFNGTDLLYFVEFLKSHYQKHDSLESLFGVNAKELNIESGLIRFHNEFFNLPDYPSRTRKHVSTPDKKSACKRLNMFLRWMVRYDSRGVDFGLWKSILPRQLVCPCDVHVERVARSLKLIQRKSVDWQTALELTASLRQFDVDDPVKYDFALFGLGITKGRRHGAGDR